ncbi:hypothetical protein BRCH_02902 [Candidatus Burkholderia brachyanthoides]|nr:hypothetical protein BRCH_02902 [Candidatus Burkholderia brachyanthoides]
MLALGVSAHAQPIEAQLDCKPNNSHDFIAPLVASNLIQTRPMRVEANSVNAFRPASGVSLRSVYGFKVYAVVAYQKDDPLFERGKGEPIADSAYGVVVWGGDDEVTQKVRAGRAATRTCIMSRPSLHYGDFLQAVGASSVAFARTLIRAAPTLSAAIRLRM